MASDSDSDSDSDVVPFSRPEPKKKIKSVNDILEQLKDVSLDDQGDERQPKDHDAGMAKLHALLTRGISSKATALQLKLAASKAKISRKYYRRATQIFSQVDMKDVFPFLALPAELRVLVYKELLVSDDRLILNWRGPMKLHKHQKSMYCAVMQTCQLCAKEGAGVLYGENVFDFEDVKQRMSIGKSMLKRIGMSNAALIRIVLCEHRAASEELSSLDPEKAETHQLTAPWLASFFKDHGIDLDQLRVLAISIVPFGHDVATKEIAKIRHPVLLQKGHEWAQEYDKWVDVKNEKIGELVDGFCGREGQFKKVGFEKGVACKIQFEMSSPVWGRHWIAYERGMR